MNDINRLNWYLETKNILAEEQAGFRQGRSTAQQTLRFTQAVKEAFNNKGSILAIFIDFKGAYDNVWKNKLLHNLDECKR